MKSYILTLLNLIACKLLEFKNKLLLPYHCGLMVQAGFIYKQSDLFKERYQQLGLDFALESFKDDARLFLWKAKKEPLIIRAKIFIDALLKREPRPYYIR